MNKTITLLLAASTAVAVWGQRMDNVTTHSKYIQAVDEYRPAPGQYVNDIPEYEPGDTEADMVRKCTERLAGNERGMVALGAYGGYITFHFDHSIANIEGQRDFAIWGNAYQEELGLFPGGGTGEAGIVAAALDFVPRVVGQSVAIHEIGRAHV